MKKFTEEQIKFLKKYAVLAKRKSFHPSASDMTQAGVNCDKIRRLFGSHQKYREAAIEYSPESFKDIVDETIFSPKSVKALEKAAGRHDRYVLTTAVEGCDVHEGFLAAIDNYNNRRKAMELILPSRDPAANVPFHLSSRLAGRHILAEDLGLNENVFVSSIRLSAKHIDPVTGLSRIGQRNGSFVYASPKQRLKMTPTSSIKVPHAIMTTGAVTKPYYNTDRYMSGRTACIAENDHVMGAVIVEVEDDSKFHFRQVQADRQGAFVDLGVQYRPDGSTREMRPEALVLGDWHSGETDPEVVKAFLQGPKSLFHVVKPKRIVIHDGFNGRSISHHEVKNKILRAQRSTYNQLDLRAELDDYAQDLEALASLPGLEEVVIVLSNHDEFLHRYLSEGRYVEDAQNHSLSLDLAKAMIAGSNPIEWYVSQKGIKNYDKLRWLKRDEDFKIANVELGAHGDKGANGAKGSLQAMEKAYGNSITGHSHTPEILRGAYQVGTSSLLRLSYTQGPSSWMHTACLLYPNGSRQLINFIEKSWRLDR